MSVEFRDWVWDSVFAPVGVLASALIVVGVVVALGLTHYYGIRYTDRFNSQGHDILILRSDKRAKPVWICADQDEDGRAKNCLSAAQIRTAARSQWHKRAER